MRLLGASVPLGNLRNFRYVWLGGRFGGGKTSTAFMLAWWLVAHGYARHVVTNIPARYASMNALEVMDPETWCLRDCVVVLDEAAQFLENWSVAKEYVAALRKLNVFLILPSVIPPHSRLQIFRIERAINWYGIGLPLWSFRWWLRTGGTMDSGWFHVWKPSAIFGLYDTEAFPQDDARVADALHVSVINLKRITKGQKPVRPDVVLADRTAAPAARKAAGQQALPGMQQEIEGLEVVADAAMEFSMAAEKIRRAVRRR